MCIISFNRQDAIQHQAYLDQIWGYNESPHQTICFDPSPPLFCPPPLFQEARYAVH